MSHSYTDISHFRAPYRNVAVGAYFDDTGRAGMINQAAAGFGAVPLMQAAAGVGACGGCGCAGMGDMMSLIPRDPEAPVLLKQALVLAGATMLATLLVDHFLDKRQRRMTPNRRRRRSRKLYGARRFVGL